MTYTIAGGRRSATNTFFTEQAPARTIYTRRPTSLVTQQSESHRHRNWGGNSPGNRRKGQCYIPCQKPWGTRSAHRYPLILARAVFLIINQHESKDIIHYHGCIIYCMRSHHCWPQHPVLDVPNHFLFLVPVCQQTREISIRRTGRSFRKRRRTQMNLLWNPRCVVCEDNTPKKGD